MGAVALFSMTKPNIVAALSPDAPAEKPPSFIAWAVQPTYNQLLGFNTDGSGIVVSGSPESAPSPSLNATIRIAKMTNAHTIGSTDKTHTIPVSGRVENVALVFPRDPQVSVVGATNYLNAFDMGRNTEIDVFYTDGTVVTKNYPKGHISNIFPYDDGKNPDKGGFVALNGNGLKQVNQQVIIYANSTLYSPIEMDISIFGFSRPNLRLQTVDTQNGTSLIADGQDGNLYIGTLNLSTATPTIAWNLLQTDSGANVQRGTTFKGQGNNIITVNSLTGKLTVLQNNSFLNTWGEAGNYVSVPPSSQNVSIIGFGDQEQCVYTRENVNGNTQIVQYGADNKRTIIHTSFGFCGFDDVMERFIGYDAQGKPALTTVDGAGNRVIITHGSRSMLPSISSGR